MTTPADQQIDTPPPQDIAAEQAVLGLALHDPRFLTEARAILNGGQEFYRPGHEQLWRALCDQQDHDQPLTIVAVANQTITNPQLTRALGGNPHNYLHTLYTAGDQAGPVHGRGAYYAKIVHDQHRLRAWQETANRLHQLTTQHDPDQIDIAALDLIEQHVTAVEHRSANGQQASSWAPQPLEIVLAGHELDPPPTILHRVDGHALLYAGAVHTLAGEPGTAKSWIACHAIVQQINGGHKATMIDFEDRASRVVQRLLDLGAHPQHLAGPNARFRYVRPTDPLNPTNTREMINAVRGTDLVVLDGVTEVLTMHALNDKDGADIARFYAMLPRRITDETGAAILMIDHVVKDDERQGRWATGSQHKLAGIDGAAYIAKLVTPFGREQHGISRVTIGKDRAGHVQGNAHGMTAAEFHLDARNPNDIKAWLEKPEAMPRGETGEGQPTILMAKIARYVEGNPGCSQTQIERSVKGKAVWVRRALTALVAEGHIDRTQAGVGHQHHLVVPYETSDPE